MSHSLSSKPTSDEMKKARGAKFRRKRPKKPKANASLGVMENYVSRYNDWCRDVKAKAKEYESKHKLRETIMRH